MFCLKAGFGGFNEGGLIFNLDWVKLNKTKIIEGVNGFFRKLDWAIAQSSLYVALPLVAGTYEKSKPSFLP